ncbi:MAG: hypothetical protein WAK91_03225 [Candidatus Acidiferrales bacterium]|jgi:hypothetical protein
MHEVSPSASFKPRYRVFRAAPTVLALWAIALGVAGCGGVPNSKPSPAPASNKLSVTPASITVAAGSTTTFTAVFTLPAAAAGSLSWSVTPVDAGTITGGGILTASATAGQYIVVATWTPANPSTAAILKGLATVEILAVPQLDSVISQDSVQASGASQVNGLIQNGAVVSQGIASILSTDDDNNIRVRSGFPIPLACAGSNTPCQ